MKTDLSLYDNSWYNPGGGTLKRILWYFTNILFFINPLNLSSGIKVHLLRLFGAKIRKGVVIKAGVNIKYPWNLSIGDYSWIGENVWIGPHSVISNRVSICDNAKILIGSIVIRNIKKAISVSGNFAVEHAKHIKSQCS